MQNYKLTLGPNLFNWKVNTWRDFYFEMADTEIDEVYLGEVVCYKRYPFFEVAMNEIVERLVSCGKKVHLSTLSLILGELEMNASKNIISKYSKTYLIEVNDVGLLGILQNQKYVIGPTVNVYNEATAQALEKQGMSRICFPYELDKKSMEIISQNIKAEKEVFVFGRMPLAIAARCYHARIHGTTKDDCRYVCEKDYNGKTIATLENENFLTINGTQTMSNTYCNLINELHSLQKIGVNIFRISPHFMDMKTVISLFKQVLEHKIESTEAFEKMKTLIPLGIEFSNGFYYGGEGRIMTKHDKGE